MLPGKSHLLPISRAALTLAAALSLLAAPAAAQDIAVAEALFNRGLADMEAGRFDSGCKALAESQRMDPRPGTLFTLATCEARSGRIATAVTRYRDYLGVYEALPQERKAQQGQRPSVAKSEINKLQSEVPQLTLTLPPGAPAGIVVKRDGDVVAEAALGVALPLDPGEHVVSTQAPDGPLWQQTIRLVKGEKKAVLLEVTSASGAAPSSSGAGSGADVVAPPGGSGPSGRRVAAYVIGGVGVAGVAVGGILGGLSLGQKDTFEKHCGAGIGSTDPTACDMTGLDAVRSARALGIGSTIGIALGAAALGVAVVLIVTESKPAKAGAPASAPWLAATLTPLESGGIAGLKGRF